MGCSLAPTIVAVFIIELIIHYYWDIIKETIDKIKAFFI